MHKGHIYQLDKLVVGTDLPALVYAFLHHYPIVFNSIDTPTSFEFLPVDFPTKLFNLPKIQIQMNSISGPVKFGTPKIELWNRLLFVMSVSGLLPFGTRDITVRQEEKYTNIKTKSRSYRYEVGEVIKFKNTYHQYKAFDWISVRSCGKHDLQYFNTDDKFVNELFFYPSERRGIDTTNRPVNDLLVISTLTEGQLEDFDYGETITRMKTTLVLKELGIRGKRNGKNPKYPRWGQPYRYHTIKLEHSKREFKRIKTNNSELDMVQSFLQEQKDLPEDTYLWKFNKRISQEGLLIK